MDRGGPRTAAHHAAQARRSGKARLRELSDTYGGGSRTARQDASAARSDGGSAPAGPPSDKAERRGMTMMAAGDAGRGAGAREDAPRRNDARCRKCKFGFNRGRKRTGTFSDEPICAGLAAKANLAVAEPHEDAQIGRIKRRGPLPRTKPSPYTAKQAGAAGARPTRSHYGEARRGCCRGSGGATGARPTRSPGPESAN